MSDLEKEIFCEKVILSFDQLKKIFGRDYELHNVIVKLIINGENRKYRIFLNKNSSEALLFKDFKEAESIDGPNPIRIIFYLGELISENIFYFKGTHFSSLDINHYILDFEEIILKDLEVFNE